MSINSKKASPEEIAKGLELLKKKNTKEERIIEQTEEELRQKNRRQYVRQKLMIQKAVIEGITVLETEIDTYIQKMKKMK
jgi:hypothetical protein